jgi:putative acetyltransferase
MLTYKRTIGSDSKFKALVDDLDNDLWIRYPDIQQDLAPYNFVDESFRVIVVQENDRQVGCGCFRPVAETGVVEIKRMYVAPTLRNKGVGKMILAKLEQWAMEEGFVRAKLETGIRQPEAIAAYEKSGYTRIPNYEPYVNVKESICLMKILADAQRTSEPKQ